MIKLLQELHTSQNDISLHPSSTRSNLSEAFIPFVNERDHLGRLITGTKRNVQGKTQLFTSKENIYPAKKQLLCRIYEDSLNNKNVKELKSSTLTTQLATDAWKTEEVLPRIKKSEHALSEVRTNRSQHSQFRLKNENNTAVSSRDNLSQGGTSSMESFNFDKMQNKQRKKKSKTAVFKEEKIPEMTEMILERFFGKEVKENKQELLLPSVLLARTKTTKTPVSVKQEQVKRFDFKRSVEMKEKTMIPQKDSAAMFVDNRSYFRKLKPENEEERFIQFHNTMDTKFIEMREKLNSLKNAINK